mmetsp:Transcript_7174/g.21928  ORF Transcript_7174/g.21928 Transcript_7174/m.21928 type:complete len:235 (+) Transcript_7174:639-1343(+)
MVLGSRGERRSVAGEGTLTSQRVSLIRDSAATIRLSISMTRFASREQTSSEAFQTTSISSSCVGPRSSLIGLAQCTAGLDSRIAGKQLEPLLSAGASQSTKSSAGAETAQTESCACLPSEPAASPKHTGAVCVEACLIPGLWSTDTSLPLPSGGASQETPRKAAGAVHGSGPLHQGSSGSASDSASEPPASAQEKRLASGRECLARLAARWHDRGSFRLSSDRTALAASEAWRA